ncbi:MAG TPA: glutathione S-transferase family protein [Myxococcota bacterium]
MSLVFHYAPWSTAGVTHFALEELGVPYEKVRVDITKGEQHAPAFKALNPMQKVPVVVHDGQPIFESAAIAIYLGEVFGVERGLFPAPGPLRGQAIQWIVWANATLNEAVQRTRLSSPTSPRVPEERRNAAMSAWGKADLEARLGVLNDHLAGKEWIVGDRFSIVDAHLGATAGWIASIELLPKNLPHLHAWLQRVTARPAFQRTSGPDA